MPSFDARGITRLRMTLMMLNFDLDVRPAAGPSRLSASNDPAGPRFILEMTASSEVRIFDVDRVERALLVQLPARAGEPSFDGFFLLGQELGLLFARPVPASAELCETSTVPDALRALNCG